MDDRATLAAALTGRYAIEREVGRGGMATVYLARDLRHERNVALKVLDPELGAVLGAERFLAEIRVTANLQHPNLLPLFDSGSANGLLFYVMPFVEGESLRARLDREHQLPVDEAVRIGVGVANALDYAHAHGVIHRDLKPENILLQHGQPVVADFGIALAVSNAGGQRVTQTGLSLGTPQYMSPEQATADRAIDGRTDIYSLGAVCYEMLAGEPPHVGTTAQAVMAKLMTEEPRALTILRKAVPPHVDAAIHCALEKLPADRFATASEFSDALQGRGTSISRSRSTPVTSSRARRLVPWLAGIAIGLIVGGAAINAWRSAHAPPHDSIHFTIEPPPGMSFARGTAERPLRISRDGQTIAFVAGPNASLFLRRLNELQPAPVAGVDAALDYHFSYDGNWLAYFSRRLPVKRIRVTAGIVTGTPRDVVGVLPDFAWTPDSQLVFVRSDGMWRVPVGGGTPARIATRDTAAEGNWANVALLPDGKTVSFRVSPKNAQNPYADGRLGFVSVGGGARTLTDIEADGVVGYADGFLFYGTSGGRIMGVPFDLASRTVRGEPTALLDNVLHNVSKGTVAELAANGTLAYMGGALMTSVEIADDHGARLSTVPVEPGRYGDVAWSPDGKRLLLRSLPYGSADIWVHDLETGRTTRLTQSGTTTDPHWMPDGKRIAYLGPMPGGGTTVYTIPADGSAPSTPLPGIGRVGVFNLTPDGKFVVAYNLATNIDSTAPRYLAIPRDGGARIPLSQQTLRGVPVVSPDGRWMSYAARAGDRREVYIRPFPQGNGQLQVSLRGGDSPRWSHDGRRIFYDADGAVRVATLDFAGGAPKVIRTDSLLPNPQENDFSPHPDGKRLAVLRDSGEGLKLIVVTNWLRDALATLKKR